VNGLKFESNEFEEVLSVTWKEAGVWKFVDIEDSAAIVGVTINTDVNNESGSISKLGFIMASRDNHEPEQELPAPTQLG
jgi:hypothetical protein